MGLLLGELTDGKLVKPRICRLFEEQAEDPITGKKMFHPKTGQPIMDPKINLSPLLGTPPFYRLAPHDGYHAVPDTEQNRAIYALYVQVTSAMVDPGKE
jgi:hypothetical protein